VADQGFGANLRQERYGARCYRQCASRQAFDRKNLVGACMTNDLTKHSCDNRISAWTIRPRRGSGVMKIKTK